MKGELHIPQLSENGITFANYAGPGTNIIEKTKKNIKPINEIDKISQAHDLRY